MSHEDEKAVVTTVPDQPPDSPVPSLQLLTEEAPDGVCFGHVPSLPGLCFKANHLSELHQIAAGKVVDYVRWLIDEGLADIDPLAAEIAHRIRRGHDTGIRVVEVERQRSAPLWISGNPAVLFNADRRALVDAEVHSLMRFVNHAVKVMRGMVASLTTTQRTWKPAGDRRSINETLIHVGNCVWWYCSRIDDTLPEPDEQPDEDPVDRAERLLEAACEFLLGVPTAVRSTIHVPLRFPTSDPNEQWNHTKVCRRQAEHAWEHLQSLGQAVRIASQHPG